VTRFFDLSLLADQSLVQAGWVESVPDDLLQATVRLLQQGSAGRAQVRPQVEVQWSFEPTRGIATVRREGRVTLLMVLVRGEEPELLATWLAELRKAPPIRTLHGDDPEAFEIVRRMPYRPFSASVLLPEGTREEQKPLVDFGRALAMAFFSAQWS
jgi:hypothetical protein